MFDSTPSAGAYRDDLLAGTQPRHRAEAQRRLPRLSVVHLKHRKVAAGGDAGDPRCIRFLAQCESHRRLPTNDMRVREHDIRPNEETGAPSLARLNRHDRRKRLRNNVLERRWCRWRCSHPPANVGRRASGREIHERITCRDRCGTRPRGAITVGLTLATRPTGCPTAPCVRQRRTRLQRSGRGRRRVRIQPGGRLRPRRPEGNRGQPEAQQKADQEEEYTATSGRGRVLVRGARFHRSRVARPENPHRQASTRCGTWRPHEGQCQTDRAEGFTDVGPSGRSPYRATGAAASGRRAGEAPTGDGASHRKRAGFAGRPLRIARGTEATD